MNYVAKRALGSPPPYKARTKRVLATIFGSLFSSLVEKDQRLPKSPGPKSYLSINELFDQTKYNVLVPVSVDLDQNLNVAVNDAADVFVKSFQSHFDLLRSVVTTLREASCNFFILRG